jgi:hypothetical protein
VDRKEHELVLERGREDAITVKRLGAELDEEQRRRGQTEVILSEAAMALRQALTVSLGGLVLFREWQGAKQPISHRAGCNMMFKSSTFLCIALNHIWNA